MPELLNNKTPKEKEVVVEKKPSKLLTEYYASIFLLAIAGFIAVGMLVHRPLIQSLKESNAETASLLAAIDNESVYLDGLKKSVSAAQSIPAAVLGEIDNALPSSQNIPSLLSQLGTAAERNGVKIESLAFNEQQVLVQQSPTATLRLIPMDVQLAVQTQSYFNMKRFLSDLENSLRLMDVVGISGSEATGDKMSYLLQLRTYSMVEIKPNAAPAITP
ncbi:MAG: type 4a pilus biogenesis protein PilO [Patescibacteria group bacterium]|nr:type 4a pilus biogenesis protein PilO [Patescibacteria group bacterium]